MKKSLIFFLFIVTFLILSKPKAVSKYCSNYKTYNNLSTFNFDKVIKKDLLINVQKICTDNICTYNLDNSSYFLIKRHIKSVVNDIKDEDKKNTYLLKGFKIDKIYFIDCN